VSGYRISDDGVFEVPEDLSKPETRLTLAPCGVLASHLEWTQEWSGSRATTLELLGLVRQSLAHTFAEVVKAAEDGGLSLRDAALCVAVRRVADAHVAYGLYP